MSRLPFEIALALRYLRPRRTFVSIITLISIVGVTLGVAVLIIVISVMQGFDEQTKARIFAFNAHLRLFAAQPMDDYRQVIAKVRQHPEVTGVTPFVLGQVLLKTEPEHGAARTLAPGVRGIDAQLEAEVSDLPSSIVAGEFDLRGRSLLIGAVLAHELQLSVGDHVALYCVANLESYEKSLRENREEASLAMDYTIRGIFDVGYNEFNGMFVLTSLANAQDMHNLGDSAHGLMVRLREPERAALVLQQLEEQFDHRIRGTTWFDENRPLLEAILVEKQVMFYLLFFIVLVAAFGIVGALIMFVVQKTREIGILKALGATSSQILGLFLGQSLTIGVCGVLAGYGLGMLALIYRNEFLLFMRDATGWELFPAAIYNFTELPALIVRQDIAVICGGSLLICILAGVIPAFIASRLQPVEALRHE